MEISNDKYVTIHYKGTLEDGTVFDSSEGKDALEFIFGLGMIIPGLEKGIEGLKAGDKKQVKVEAKDAYGELREEAKQEVPKDQFPPEIELKEGLQLMAQGPQGPMPVLIAQIKESTVVVDFNHPLAGKALTFDIEVVDVRDSTPEDMQKFMPKPPEGECGSCSSSGSCGPGGCN